jgi:hypothetical protein
MAVDERAPPAASQNKTCVVTASQELSESPARR